MASTDPLDDLFRQALEGVEPPPPPAMDMAAMARAAKAGAATNSTGRARWWKRAGFALLLLIGAYSAFRLAHGEGKEDQLAARGENGAVEVDQRTGQTALEPEVIRETERAANAQALQSSEGLNTSTAALQSNRDMVSGPFATTKTTGHDRTPIARTPQHSSPSPTIKAEGQAQAPRTVVLADREPEGALANNGALNEAAPKNLDGAQDEPKGEMDRPVAPAEASSGSTERTVPESLRVRGVQRAELAYALMIAALPAPPSESPITRWTISPWFSMDRSTYTDSRTGSDAYLEQLNTDRGLTGTVGVRLQYALDRHWALMSGVQYSDKGSLVGVVRTTAERATTYALSGTYYEVPVAIKYTLPAESKEFYARLGVAFQFNSKSGADRVMLRDEEVHELSTVVLSSGSVGTTVDLGLGVQFRLRKGVGFFVEPAYRFGLSPVVKHPSFDQLPFNPKVNSLCLGMGLSFQLHHR